MPELLDVDSPTAPYSSALIQAFCFSLLTLFSVHQTFSWGFGLVAPTFVEGALRTMQGINPYLPPNMPLADQFQYPPFFAWLYYPLTKLNPIPQGIVWMSINTFFFWLGLSRWQTLRFTSKKAFWWALLFLALCEMELECTIKDRQNEAIIVGCILLGVRDYIDNRNWPAAAWLLLGTGIKVLPIVFAFLLLFPRRPQFWRAVLVMGALVVVAPCINLGFRGVELFFVWIAHMLRAVLPTFGQMDLASILARWSVPHGIALLTRHFVCLLTVSVLLLSRTRLKRSFPWDLWIGLVFMGILLCSPKTEKSSFVMFAPFCLFYGKYVRSSVAEKNYLPLIGYLTAILLVSGVHNDLFFPRLIWPQLKFSTITKPYGAIVAWIFSLTPLLGLLYKGQSVGSRIDAIPLPPNAVTG